MLASVISGQITLQQPSCSCPSSTMSWTMISSIIQMLLTAFGLKTRLSTTTRCSAVSLTWPSARRGIICATMRLRCSGGETSKSLVEMRVSWLCGQCCSVGDHNWNDYTEQKLKQLFAGAYTILHYSYKVIVMATLLFLLLLKPCLVD